MNEALLGFESVVEFSCVLEVDDDDDDDDDAGKVRRGEEK